MFKKEGRIGEERRRFQSGGLPGLPMRLAQSESVSLFSRPDPHSEAAGSHKRMFLTESGVFFLLEE